MISSRLLEEITENLYKSRIDLGYNTNSNSIICTRGRIVPVIVSDDIAKSQYDPKKREIYLSTKGNKTIGELEKELLHEKTHVDIFPYDLISYFSLYATAVALTILKMPDTVSKVGFVVIETVFFLSHLTFNGYSDLIINIMNRFRYKRST